MTGSGDDSAAPAADLRDSLLRLGRLMDHVEQKDALISGAIQECAALLDCEAASLALCDQAAGTLKFAFAMGGAESEILSASLPLDKGILGKVARESRPYVTNDPAHDPNWFGDFDTTTGFVTRNLAAAPMIEGNEVVGVLEAINKRGQGGFKADDVEVLQIVADQARLTLRIHRLIEARMKSERLAGIGLAVADISHTAKNLLMRIEFPVAIIKRAAQDRSWDSVDKTLPVMERGIVAIGALIRDMLKYSKPHEHVVRDVDVTALFAVIASDLKTELDEKRIGLVVKGIESPLVWPMDEEIFKAALMNLIGNAIDALANTEGSRICIEFAAIHEERRLRIAIEDNGPGIPPEILPRIFDPFFSTKGGKGTGLGLANVKKGIEDMHGEITCESPPGAGARFVILLPKNL